MDAAFAFSVTLLVVSIDQIPNTTADLMDAMRGIPSFALSVLMIFLFWNGHRTWSRRFGLEDARATGLSWALVVSVLCFVYPLKFMMNTIVEVATLGALETPAEFLLPATKESMLGELYLMFTVYGVGFAWMSGLFCLMNAHALSMRQALSLSVAEIYETQTDRAVWGVAAMTGGVSVVLAAFTPPSVFAWPGMVYWALPILIPLYTVRRNRRAPQVSVLDTRRRSGRLKRDRRSPRQKARLRQRQ